jgi:hypothetical protein
LQGNLSFFFPWKFSIFKNNSPLVSLYLCLFLEDDDEEDDDLLQEMNVSEEQEEEEG